MEQIVVSGGFDDLRSRKVRFLEEASRLGEVNLLLWSDKVIEDYSGAPPKFPFEERRYLVGSLRFVQRIWPVDHILDVDRLPEYPDLHPDLWAVEESDHTQAKIDYSTQRQISYHVIKNAQLAGFPITLNPTHDPAAIRKKVLVTGCFDWLHSGHIRFFEEVSQLGDLYVVVGHDENVRLLKGDGHPLFGQDERRYMVHAIRFVKEALISSGHGWLDAEPEIDLIRPDIYAVNEDGDKPEKQAFCEEHGIELVVLKRLPKEGLPRRESSLLRGF